MVFRIAQLVVLVSVIFVRVPSANADDSAVKEPMPKSWQADAELTGVHFVDANLGWAVGATGTMLRTRDGGLTWTHQTASQRFRKDTMRLEQKVDHLENGRFTGSTGVLGRQAETSSFSCRFESVSFVDANQGWAVGGVKVPYIDRTHAVVMQTRDGGLSWRSVETHGLPRLRKIHFSNVQQGMAVGDSGNVFTGGIFQTNNGGRSWSGKLFPFDQDWRDVERTGAGFVTINAAGQLGHIQNNQYENSVLIGLPAGMPVVFHDVLMLDQSRGVALANDGLVFKTSNAGLSWNRVPVEKQHPQLAGVDWWTAAVAGDRIKLAGNPGSIVATIDLAEDRIDLHKTPVRSKLNQLFFLDAKRGWAVGEFGVVLSTQDGGKVWRQQRGNTRGLAMMVVAPTANQAPVDLFARYAAEDNLACSLVVIEDSQANFESARQASERLGCSSHELLSLKRSGDSSTASPQSMLAKLVRSIRVNRPSVVVSQARKSFDPQAGDAFQTVAQAISMAADPRAFPEQFELGLQVHRVERLVVQDPIGSISVNGSRMLVQSGTQLRDKIALSRALLDKPVINPEPDHYRIVNLQSNYQDAARGDFFRGLSKQRLVTRLGKSNLRGNLMAIKFANDSARQLDTFINFKIGKPQDVAVWRLQLRRFLNSMEVDVHSGSDWTMRLIEEYLAEANTTLAVESAEMLVSRFPNSPYAVAVATWLARYYSSHELGRLAFEQQIKNGVLQQDGTLSRASRLASKYSSAPETQINDGVATLTWKPVQSMESTTNETSSNVALARLESSVEFDELPKTTPPFFAERLKRAAQLVSFVGQKDPDFAAGSYCRWLEVQLAKRLSAVGAAQIDSLPDRYGKLANQGLVKIIAGSTPNPVVQSIAEQAKRELGLLQENSGEEKDWAAPVTLPPTKCRLIDARPNLDGRLEESFWRTAKRIPIQRGSDGSRWPNSYLQLCRDQEFLYVAVVCQKIPGVNYQSFRKMPRVRDSDLNPNDWVDIELDLDNDFATSFRFAVDCHGMASESCQWAKDWNPDWFVAQDESATQWIVEAAVPLKAMVAAKIGTNETWSIRALRTNTVMVTPKDQSIFKHRPLRKPGVRVSF
jgi:photosystem II stability/assembly factor-like uncharacterized protein